MNIEWELEAQDDLHLLSQHPLNNHITTQCLIEVVW
ncbi:MAG: hypothetical protein ACI9OJ_005601 [Myxococcota bacterium]|jgi:hypothetical protein